MFENSLAIKLIKKLVGIFSAIAVCFKNSILYKAVCGVSDGIAGLFSKSLFHDLFTRRDIEHNSPTSRFYRFYTGMIKLVTAFSAKIFDILSRVYQNSRMSGVIGFINRIWLDSKIGSLVRKLLDPYTCFFGFAIAAMFIVPHDFWNNLFGVALALIAALWVLYGHYKNKDTVCLMPQRTYLSLLLFFACIVLSTVCSQNRTDSIRIFVFFLTSVILCLSVSAFTSHKTSFRSFCGMLYVCVIITSVIGVIQAIIGVETDASLTDLKLNADMPGRIFSTMGNANNFAQFLVLFMPYCAAFALTAKSRLKKIALTFLLALPFTALLQTYSRSGWIAFAVAVAVFVAMSNRRLVPVFILICIAAIPFLPETVLDRILTIGNMQDSSSSYRILIWEGARNMLSKWWVIGLGIGPGAFKEVYHAFAIGGTQNVAHCHMQFMEVFLETGILGFVCFVWMTFSLIRRALISTSTKDKDIKYFASAASASMTSIIFIGLFEYYWFYPRVMFAFFISAGLAIGVYKMWQAEKEKDAENSLNN